MTEIYLKAVKRVRCPFKKKDSDEWEQDPGSCPCMYPKPCEVEVLVPYIPPYTPPDPV